MHKLHLLAAPADAFPDNWDIAGSMQKNGRTDAFVARPSRRLTGLMTLISLAVVWLCFGGARALGATPTPGLEWVSYVAGLLLAAFGLFWARDLFDTGERIVVNDSERIEACFAGPRRQPASPPLEGHRRADRRRLAMLLLGAAAAGLWFVARG